MTKYTLVLELLYFYEHFFYNKKFSIYFLLLNCCSHILSYYGSIVWFLAVSLNGTINHIDW